MAFGIQAGLSLYAELLPNIRQIMLHVSLADSLFSSESSGIPGIPVDPLDNKFSLTLQPSRRSVCLSGPWGERTFDLPARVSVSAYTTLATRPIRIYWGVVKHNEHNELTYRLQVDETSPSVGPRLPDGGASFVNNGLQVPWTSKDMNSESRIRCRQCKNILFNPSEKGGIIWKDLPSSDWAEMMDLWHCHKPDAHEDGHGDATNYTGPHVNDENETIKGYGAANQIVCAPGTVLIDILSFVMAEDDCQGLEKSETKLNVDFCWRTFPHDLVSDTTAQYQYSTINLFRNITSGDFAPLITLLEILQKPSLSSSSAYDTYNGDQQSASKTHPVVSLSCSWCGAIVGEEDTSFPSLRLYKTNVSVLQKPKDEISSDDDLWESYPVDMIVGTQLLELVERIGARRFAVHSTDYKLPDSQGSRSGLLANYDQLTHAIAQNKLWLFNPDLRYSSLSSGSGADGDVSTTTAQRAVKVFYKEVADIQSMLDPAQGTPSPTAVEEVSLPANVYDVMKQALERSSETLPMSGRQFGEWSVGLVSRFEEAGLTART
ncbi:hypothetical protein ACO22_03977 [Paracoccidioides brasiliensis]|uniref:Ubiquitin-conjugating enzyme E2-binding protein n=1 Tax=Paracoccidioides brasiliensis TaxID=121759 RepID=A0A1D2JEG1_PARBR|nr:hypothetical protein ACO22_03977 [Paracoccidioides brasiliensis]